MKLLSLSRRFLAVVLVVVPLVLTLSTGAGGAGAGGAGAPDGRTEVMDVGGHDRPARRARMLQRRIVGEAQVATEPEDDRRRGL